jgi:hypothetical protein
MKIRWRSVGLRGIRGVEWESIPATMLGPLVWQAMARWCQ